MRVIPYTNIQIDKDPRVPVVRSILSNMINKTDVEKCIVTVMPDNTMVAICQLTTIFSCNLKECIPGYMIIMDYTTFNDEYVEEYKLDKDEYVLFNQSSTEIYLNIQNAINSYVYNTTNYQLVDKIEDLTSFPDLQSYFNIKADEGCKFFKGYNNRFCIPMWTKFPNVTKSDSVDLYVYRFDESSDLVVWKIKKKKIGRDWFIIFRVMKVI